MHNISSTKDELKRMFNMESEKINRKITSDTVLNKVEKVIPRLKQLSYEEVLTVNDVLDRKKEQQNFRKEKGKGKTTKKLNNGGPIKNKINTNSEKIGKLSTKCKNTIIFFVYLRRVN